VGKTPQDFVHQSRQLDELFQELLELRMRVRQAERAARERPDINPDGSSPKKPQGRKRGKLNS